MSASWLICVDDSRHEVSLQRLKVYEAVPDQLAEQTGMVRVIDEDEEDYLFEKSRFIDPKLDAAVVAELHKASR